MNFVEILRKKSAMKTFLCEKCCFLAEKWQFYGCKYKDFAFSGKNGQKDFAFSGKSDKKDFAFSGILSELRRGYEIS